MKLYILIFALLILNINAVRAQASWRFPVAFEDGVGAKDTVWMIWDTTATGGFYPVIVDTALGEGHFNFNYNVFNVWIYNTAGDSTKTFALPYIYYPNHSLEVRAFNYQYPITVSWDSSMFNSPILPSQPVITYAKIDNDYFFGVNNDPPAQMFNMLWDNHALAPAFNWGSQSQFPMHFYLSGTVGINSLEQLSNSLKVCPNPFSSTFDIKSDKLISSAIIFNAATSEIITELFRNNYEATISNMNNLAPGLYIIKFITTQTTSYYAKIIKLP